VLGIFQWFSAVPYAAESESKEDGNFRAESDTRSDCWSYWKGVLWGRNITNLVIRSTLSLRSRQG
jgi:hypothetical protein